MASVESLRDRWERMAPRERRLLVILGGTFIICILSWIAFTIRDGLRAIEAKNDETRAALDLLAHYRAAAAEPTDEGPQAVIPDEAIQLSTYLEQAATEVGLTIPDYSPRPATQKGHYNEITMNINLKGVTIEELVKFLEKVETTERTVVVTSMHVSREFRDNEKLDVDMTVATFEKAKEKKPEAPAGGTGAAPAAGEEG